VVVEAVADSAERGLGLSYASRAAAVVVQDTLEDVVRGSDVDRVGEAWTRMISRVRNVGRPGVAANAISAVDIALWDLKARAAGLPLFKLLGATRDSVPIYGSGGFTSYTLEQLVEQLSTWVEQAIPRVKMKIGMDWGSRASVDIDRATAVRQGIGTGPQLFVDANGAFHAQQAVQVAAALSDRAGVTYFEEPTSSDQLDQLHLVRSRAPMDVAAGEYGYDPWYFSRMLRAEAVDILQADITRCLGVTGWLRAADLAYSAGVPLSAHCAPSMHLHAACAAPQISHLEYFWDHIRIDGMMLAGAPQPENGVLKPDPSAPGLGLDVKRTDVEQFRIL
jgi:L-alanine-DL-glutamate epimerase-like enolase superfamily enzyme